MVEHKFMSVIEPGLLGLIGDTFRFQHLPMQRFCLLALLRRDFDPYQCRLGLRWK